MPEIHFDLAEGARLAVLDVGDHLRVRLVATEPRRGFVDFVRV
jgi:hypothetical protein